jgi:hypothetical protein
MVSVSESGAGGGGHCSRMSGLGFSTSGSNAIRPIRFAQAPIEHSDLVNVWICVELNYWEDLPGVAAPKPRGAATPQVFLVAAANRTPPLRARPNLQADECGVLSLESF